MGVDTKALLETAKSWFSEEKLMGLINGLIDKIPANIMAIYNSHKALCLFGAVCLLILIAFEGYRIVKMLVTAGSAFAFGYVGLTYLTQYVPESIKSKVPDIVEFEALVAIACALVAVFLCGFAFNLVIAIIGGAAGYFVGVTYLFPMVIGYFHTLDFLQTVEVKYAFGGVLAVLGALFLTALFKGLFMVGTAFGCSIGAAVLLQMFLAPSADESLKLSFIVLGVALGIFAMMRQHKEERRALEIIF